MLSDLNNFHSLEVVDRVRETQLQVGKNSDNFAVKGLKKNEQNICDISIYFDWDERKLSYYLFSCISGSCLEV